MEIITVGMTLIAGAVIYKGAVVVVNGLTMYGEGKSQNSPSKQEEGMEKAAGGAFIVVIGLVFVPVMQRWLEGLM